MSAPSAVGAEPARGPWVKRLAAVALLAALLAAVRLLPVERWLVDFVAWVRGAGVRGMVVFALVYVLATVLFLPGVILTLGAGFAYGVVTGTAVVWVASNLGAVAAFLLGRTLARAAIAARIGTNPRFAAIDRAVGTQGLKIVLLVRLSPVFPFNLLNYALGLTLDLFNVTNNRGKRRRIAKRLGRRGRRQNHLARANLKHKRSNCGRNFGEVADTCCEESDAGFNI